MRNKGAIWTLAIALAVVCIYQLSFTWKAVSIRKAAIEYATNTETQELDEVKQKYFLDSVSAEKIFFFDLFTYEECIQKELNFGLDLKGGMNIILEISVTDVIRNLSRNPADTTLNLAIAKAKEMQKESSADFMDLFGEAYTQINPTAQLEGLFRTKELDIPFGTSNEDVIAIIKNEAEGAIDNAFEIIRTRIDQFGVAQPNIQKLEAAGRILVDLPGVKDKKRVRDLLQGTAHLEFWETFENAEMQGALFEANNAVKAYLEEQKLLKSPDEEKEPADATTPVPEINADEPSLLAAGEDSEKDTASSLLDIAENAPEDTTSNLNMEDAYPLFQALLPMVGEGSKPFPGSTIGLAELKDTATVNKYLALAVEQNLFPTGTKLFWSAKPRDLGEESSDSKKLFELHAIKAGRDGKPALDGDVITTARPDNDPESGASYVSMTMNTAGAKDWARITKENEKRCIAIVMDSRVYSAPTVQNQITGGSSQITGNFTTQEATDLANLLRSGKLPAPARIIQETVVGPSLGQKAVNDGLKSFMIAFLVILLYMVVYYSRNGGVVADIALIVNMFFIIGVLASLGAALTLPGIAGIVLTIGMSVDANVLIYERIREELSAGKGIKLAIKDGYKHAYSAIIDANVTTLVTAIILLLFGTGPIKGFATTLVIGICTSLFTAIFITRLIIEGWLKKNKEFTFSTKLSEGAFKNTKIKFLDIRKTPYVISGIIVAISLFSIIAGKQLDLGVDFKGGRNYILQFSQDIDNKEIAQLLTPAFNNDEPKVIQYGEDNQVRITTMFRVDDEGTEVDEEIQIAIFGALKSKLGDISYEDFVENNLAASQKVGATIADDIKRESLFVFFGALVFMFIYIFLRFRNWQFGLGAVAALVHDSLIVLGLFSLLYGVLPFSLEIDQAFIAAILTVVGYSINDTVVVFDRIREYILLYPKRERREIMNLALNSTLSRTFNTSISTFLVLLTIFILGGEAIRGFTFALMIGVVVGTYSSLFIATPLVYDTVMKAETKRVLKGKKRS